MIASRSTFAGDKRKHCPAIQLSILLPMIKAAMAQDELFSFQTQTVFGREVKDVAHPKVRLNPDLSFVPLANLGALICVSLS